jgi:uncharacterized coiled-coil protein SlyX
MNELDHYAHKTIDELRRQLAAQRRYIEELEKQLAAQRRYIEELEKQLEPSVIAEIRDNLSNQK